MRTALAGRATIGLALLVSLVIVAPARAVPIDKVRPLLTYQGFLTLDGAPVDGDTEFKFRLYKSPTSTDQANLVWEEEWLAGNKVAVANGSVNVVLGKVNPFQLATVFLENSPLYLEVEVVSVNGEAKNAILSPRMELTTVPTSFVSENTLNIRGLDPVTYFSDKDLKVKSLDLGSGTLSCSGCIGSSALDVGKVVDGIIGDGFVKDSNGKLGLSLGSGLTLNGSKQLSIDTSSIAQKSDLGSYYTKTEADSAFYSKTAVDDGFYSKTDADSKFAPKTTTGLTIACDWAGKRFVSSGSAAGGLGDLLNVGTCITCTSNVVTAMSMTTNGCQ
ncbi:MAG: hypothetical protein KC609_15030 [Myxococcales bacterium]|nr:hypothetical protein [Myxococcales bacterium]